MAMGSCIMVKSLAPQGALAPGTRPELMRSVTLCTSSLYCSGRRLRGAPFSITRSYCTTVFSRNDVLNMSVASCFQQSEAIRTVNLPFSSSLTHVGQLPSLIQIHTQFGSNVVSSLVRSTVEAVRPHVRLSVHAMKVGRWIRRLRPLRLYVCSRRLSYYPILLAIGSLLLICSPSPTSGVFAISDFGSPNRHPQRPRRRSSTRIPECRHEVY